MLLVALERGGAPRGARLCARSDGVAWHSAGVEPYSNVLVEEGGSTLVSTRERPKLIFDAAGEPTHLITAVSAVTHCATACVNCKYAGHTYTDIAPLATAGARRR